MEPRHSHPSPPPGKPRPSPRRQVPGAQEPVPAATAATAHWLPAPSPATSPGVMSPIRPARLIRPLVHALHAYVPGEQP
ncbi:MAG: hypothetical protein ACKO3N_14100, partial [Verrucomicrobiota bacterium]